MKSQQNHMKTQQIALNRNKTAWNRNETAFILFSFTQNRSRKRAGGEQSVEQREVGVERQHAARQRQPTPRNPRFGSSGNPDQRIWTGSEAEDKVIQIVQDGAIKDS